MANTQLDEQLAQLQSAFNHWQQTLLNACLPHSHQQPGEIGQPQPDGGISGPVHRGYRLIIAPAWRRARPLRFGLQGITISHQADSGWYHSNLLLADHFAGHDDRGPQAVRYCRSLGPDWYLPDIDELQAILAVAPQIDAADTSDTTRHFSALADQPIWTSSPARHGHWSLRASDSLREDRNRRHDAWVIPIRRIALP